ncbi:hypothetical protein BJ165DRAFT_1577549 [Panaeolus papilionaceus]|nr:hypothetical protein BJ165DRAFT_1577549 [Panaeolus papilionaceus]
MSEQATIKLLNPYTPMAFLPPELAIQTTNSTYILVGSTAVFMWDLLDNIPNDYRILTKYKFSVANVVYIISRLGALGLVLSATLFTSSAITTDCDRFFKIVGAFYPITIPATSLLFLFRLKAVFNGNTVIVTFFLVVWTALLAMSIAIPWGIDGANIGPTQYCVASGVKNFVSAPTVMAFASDTLILFAISWKLMTTSSVSHRGIRGVKGMILGHYLPSFSRALLQSGQRYYTVTVSLNLLAVAMLFAPAIPPIYHVVFVGPNVALMNIMACRVFRDTKFGLIQDTSMSSDSTKIGNSVPLRVTRDHDNAFEMSNGDQRRSPSDTVMHVVHITKEVHYASDQDSNV